LIPLQTRPMYELRRCRVRGEGSKKIELHF
jgi:hypothetical protein